MEMLTILPFDIRERKYYHWSRGGGYECSSKGDKRFSAFNAIMKDGFSIEHHYQVFIKGYPSIKEGKGKPPLTPMTKEYQWFLYKNLWVNWAANNKDLIDELAVAAAYSGYVISDVFASTEINQARALAYVLNSYSSVVLGHCAIHYLGLDLSPNGNGLDYSRMCFDIDNVTTSDPVDMDIVSATSYNGRPIIAKCFTSNGVVRKDGRLSMGRGSALAFREAYPGLDLAIGNYVSRYGNEVCVVDNAFNTVTNRYERVISFPTKYHFREASNMSLIIESSLKLAKLTEYLRDPLRGDGVILLPCPGATNGWIPWEDTSRLIDPLLPDNVIYVRRGV